MDFWYRLICFSIVGQPPGDPLAQTSFGEGMGKHRDEYKTYKASISFIEALYSVQGTHRQHAHTAMRHWQCSAAFFTRMQQLLTDQRG
jgi:hypothetical protein